MAITGAFTIFTADLDTARTFWADGLGFAIEESPAGFRASRDGFAVEVEGGARPRKRSRRWLAEASVYVTLRVDDFDRFHRDLTKRGVEFLDEVTAGDDGRRVTGFADPDGNLFEIAERHPRLPAAAAPAAAGEDVAEA